MDMTDQRIGALEGRIAELEGREAAHRSIVGVLARSLAHKGIGAPQEIAETIDGWEAYFAPLKASTPPVDHTDLDNKKMQGFLSAIENFFDEARKGLPRPATSE